MAPELFFQKNVIEQLGFVGKCLNLKIYVRELSLIEEGSNLSREAFGEGRILSLESFSRNLPGFLGGKKMDCEIIRFGGP